MNHKAEITYGNLCHKVLEVCRLLLERNVIGKSSLNGSTSFKKEFQAIVNHIYQECFVDVVLNAIDAHISDESDDFFVQSLQETTNQSFPDSPRADDVWIFGYGSLIWKADFPFIDRRRGFIKGYQRRFYQNSIDHRGTPQRPGRVVTLLPSGRSEDRVYGVAYRIPAQKCLHVLAHLDFREKNGYERRTLEFHEYPEEAGSKLDVIMYVATPENESYAGDVWQQNDIVEQILRSAGPSGTNREYLFNLATAMKALFPGAEDKHLFDLENEVRRKAALEEQLILEGALKDEISGILSSSVELVGCNREEELLHKFQILRNKCTNPAWKDALLSRA